jgi:sugar lactone lactonase YvrE
MSGERVIAADGLGRAVAAVTALVTMAMLAGAGQAKAAPDRGGPGAARSVHLAAAAAAGTFYGWAMLAGHIYTVAGNGTAGFSGDGRPATGAELNQPGDVTVDAAGNLVIADTANLRVRVVAASTGAFYGQAMTAGHIYTVAGDGTSGSSGDVGPATSAQLEAPPDVAVDPAGNLLIADTSNNTILVAAASTGTVFGQAMTAGHIYAVAGHGGGDGFAGDGRPATSLGVAMNLPEGVAADPSGNLLIADTRNNRIREVTG